MGSIFAMKFGMIYCYPCGKTIKFASNLCRVCKFLRCFSALGILLILDRACLVAGFGLVLRLNFTILGSSIKPFMPSRLLYVA
ncbi:hypothetical protein CAMGR0001_1413 [Campylobacter gracilis RM3268]|uniref:Uncharacterized protein n=1 Tax=Campylobacter gracilis RM3268 TaxID=553220 RepID=C8PJL3_9BACT|nr:hypothetical protein CAMGR0001_1413 [Campylobacter gracilis RM3268]